MAEQQGFFPYSGKLGDTVGYRRGQKHFERVKTRSYQPNEESRKSGAEFGTGSTGCVLLKMAFRPLLLRAFTMDLHNRLAGRLREIIRSGAIDKKGKRGVFDGNLKLLKGFQFNPAVNFQRLIQMEVNASVSTKEVKVSIRPFEWNGTIKAPANADRVKIGCCCVFADFNTGSYTALKTDDLRLEKGKKFSGGRFEVPVPEEEELAVLLMMTVFFEGDMGGSTSTINNKQYQAGMILDAVHIKCGEIVQFIADERPKVEKKVPTPPDAFWTLGWEE